MKRPLATLVTLLLASTMIVGAAAGPAAAQCSSTALGVNADAVSDVGVSQTVIQVNAGSIAQVGSAISLGGDATVIQDSDFGQGNYNDQC